MKVSKDYPVIAWWSGGVTSAVTCKICLDWFGKENVRVVFIDTRNEYLDTYTFKHQCEKWYGVSIETITNSKYRNIQEVWEKHLSLNTATGAICSTELKRKVREDFQRVNTFSYQAFGYEYDPNEIKRAWTMSKNNPDANPMFPLLAMILNKKDCIEMIQNENSLFLTLHIPKSYRMGYNNNNCGETGCVQGGIGYWQLKKIKEPKVFDKMAETEHHLTDLKGQPVTMLKDQSKGGGLVFLKPHPSYPDIKDISMMKGREPKPLMECNGFCGTNDLVKNETQEEINYVD